MKFTYDDSEEEDDGLQLFVLYPVITEPTVFVSHRRIRQLWTTTLRESGKCSSCNQLLDTPHLFICHWNGLVGSDPKELDY